MSWFYSAGGEQKGPVELAEFEALIAQGIIRPETLVWQPGMPNWQPASAARPDLLPPAIPGMGPVPVYVADPPYDGRRYGGFWMRFLARIVDGLVLLIPSGIVILLVVGPAFFRAVIDGNFSVLTEGTTMLMVASLLNALMYAAYEAFTTSTYGGTLGKMALGLRVITPEGNNLNLQQALIRHLLYAGGGIIGAILPAVAVLNGIWILVDNIAAGLDSRKRAIHDRIANTFVIKK